MKHIQAGTIGSYDIVMERAYPPQDLRIINSVDTDIQILNGIVGILSLTLTSNQYLSVSRYYDKRVAAKQQEVANERDINTRVKGALAAAHEYLNTFDGIQFMKEVREMVASQPVPIKVPMKESEPGTGETPDVSFPVPPGMKCGKFMEDPN